MQRLDPEQMRFWDQAAWTYHKQMNEKALSYLNGRGINTGSVGTFRLGIVEDPLPGHEMMRGRIAIPYLKKLGVVCLKFRCIEDHDCKAKKCPKYLSDGQHWLYNTADLDVPSPHIALCEGEFDAIILHQSGIPAVGIPGVESWKGREWWPDLFAGHRRKFMFADNDSSKDKNYGHDLARRVMADVAGTRLVTLPEDHDVSETWRDYGPEELFARSGLEQPASHLQLVA